MSKYQTLDYFWYLQRNYTVFPFCSLYAKSKKELKSCDRDSTTWEEKILTNKKQSFYNSYMGEKILQIMSLSDDMLLTNTWQVEFVCTDK